MDAKNIFIAAQATLRRVEWRRPTPDSEWSYIADGEDMDPAVVQRRIDAFFSAGHLYLVTDRHRSKQVARIVASAEITNALSSTDATLCDTEFRDFMVFSRLGVCKEGTAR
jgi:hypothetical protein